MSAAVESQTVPAAAGVAGGWCWDSSGTAWLEDLHAIYGGLGSGRLVIIGGPGSGKSGEAVLLILAALKYRAQRPEKDRELVPVPVLVTAHGWDPTTQSIEHWLAARLQQTYPLFCRQGRPEKSR